MLAGEQDGEVIAWDTISGSRAFQTRLSPYPASGFVPVSPNPSAFSHSGKFLALSAAGAPTEVLEWPSGRKLYSLESPVGGNNAIAFSRDDSRIASAGVDGTVRIYETSTGKLLARNDDFSAEVFAIDFTADGQQVVAAGADKMILFIDASTGRRVRLLAQFSDPVAYVEVSPDGKCLSVVLAKAESQSLAASVSLWDTTSGQKKSEWIPPTVVIGAAWSPNGQWLLATASTQTIHLWHIH